MALVTLQTIFQDAFPAYEQRHALACSRAPSRPRHHAVSHRSAGRPCPSLSGWSYVPHLVQLLSASVVSAMCLPPGTDQAGLALFQQARLLEVGTLRTRPMRQELGRCGDIRPSGQAWTWPPRVPGDTA